MILLVRKLLLVLTRDQVVADEFPGSRLVEAKWIFEGRLLSVCSDAKDLLALTPNGLRLPKISNDFASISDKPSGADV